MLEYLKKFEQMISVGVRNKTFEKSGLVSVRGSKLGKTKFGILIGFTIDSDIEFVIDYYGYFKRSRGFTSRIKLLKKEAPSKQIKAIETITVHFASIRMEQIALLKPSLLEEFPQFKSFILEKRGFKKSA
jgi:hypothetical protein